MNEAFQERVVFASNEEDGITVRHIRLRGSNAETGYHLAMLAKDRNGLNLRKQTGDPLLIRCRNEYMRSHYPEHYERMRGIAAAAGIDLDLGRQECGVLPLQRPQVGCSCVYFPGHTTSSGAALMSRNFDFALEAVPEPYVCEVYPDQGIPALYMCGFELVSGVLDGVNAEGLMVAVLADDESPVQYPMEPNEDRQVGMHELQMMRYLLDRCRNVDEAKEALLSMKHHYAAMPLHYMIGDRSGRSFVWERSYTGNREFIIDGQKRPQAVTNFMLHRYQAGETYPDTDRVTGDMYDRYETLQRELAHTGKFSVEDAKRMLACVFCQTEDRSGQTLWHNVYNADECSMEISFYAGREVGSQRSKRTEYVRFQLQ